MYTIDKSYTFKQIINKSEFICTVYPVNSVDQINEILTKTRKTYYDATHNCYAYILGDNGETAKNSDDGEPSQTAGIVIYEVLRKNQLTNVLAIVTRYFGGIKLGAGGLIRAYGSSTSNAIKDIQLLKIQKCYIMELNFAYPLLNCISKITSSYQELAKDFGDSITMQILIPVEKKEEITKDLISSTKDCINIKIIKEITKAM